MADTVIGPSGLHLKKELTALQNARFFRDPETCSSWKSPSSSRSFDATSVFNYEKGTRKDRKGVIESDGACEVPPRSQKRRKNVYLSNWGRRSSKSSDSGMKLDEETMQGSFRGSPQDRFRNPTKMDPKSSTYIGRTNRKLRRNGVSRKRVLRRPVISKMLDLPSSSLLALNSDEQSDDTKHSNSEDLRQATHERTQNIGYASHFASNKLSTRYVGQSYSTVGSTDETTSFDEDEVDRLHLKSRQGCGISCYGTKRTKPRGCGGCHSPSLSDTLIRTRGCSILCGSQTSSSKKRSSDSYKQRWLSKSSQGLPLLIDGCHGGRSSVGTTTVSDELSTNVSELDLEALSRLDGTRWSLRRSQGLEENREQRSLSEKFRPRSFNEIIGQNIVVQSLNNAILRGRIAPAYIFQGPRGTGKTSIARIFAAALNCLSIEENKPCGFCGDCTDFATGNGSNMREVDATNKKDLARVRLLMKRILVSTAFSQYNVFVVNECHMLSSKSWSAFAKFVEEPIPRLVFIFITSDRDNLPRPIVSRCQKYIFHKIKDADIIYRLRKISAEENLDFELGALDLIALNSGGSLRDAETMLEQLSLLGKRITTSLVNELVGIVSDERLLDLLEVALTSNTPETVKKSRELMDSGVDPVALMSQLAGLIMNIIAGSYHTGNSGYSGRFSGKSLTEAELESLQAALKVLSDAEKQLRLSSEHSTWFTAAILQLGSAPNLELTLPSSSRSNEESNKKINVGKFDEVKETSLCIGSNPLLTQQHSSWSSIPNITHGCYSPHDRPSYSLPMRENVNCNLLPTNSISVDRNTLDAAHKDDAAINRDLGCLSRAQLDEIWRRCIERCHSMTLRQLLSDHGKLVSIADNEGVLVAYIAFGDDNVKSRAERFLTSITNSIELVLGHIVEVRIGLLPETYLKAPKSVTEQHRSTPLLPRRSVSYTKGNNGIRGTKGRWQDLSEQITLARERLESAWLPAAEKGAPLLAGHLEKNIFLAKNGVTDKNQNGSSMTPSVSSKLWQDEPNRKVEESSINEESSIHDNDSQDHHTEQIVGSGDQSYYAISPSFLHSNSFKSALGKEKPGCGSGPGRGICCWNISKADRSKVKQSKGERSRKRRGLLCFRLHRSPMQTDFRLRR